MKSCPYCGTDWPHHSVRCVGGVPAVDLDDNRGLAGRVISGYGIIGRIGEGGMGTVYLAVDNITEQRLDAVKVLNRDLVVDRERMRREAVTANRVDHPNVCQIYNYVEAYDAVAGETLTLIAMELVRGPTLREVQNQSGGILELNRAARVVKEVANALQAVHSGGIIHRDIKPTNIIVTNDQDGTERVKLVDFGIAKKEGGGEGQDLTEAGFVAATVHYASPEQLTGEAEPRSDIYSLGVVLFELLTGRRPFEAPNQAALYGRILDPKVSVPRLGQIRPDLQFPKALQSILDRALAREPDRRYPNAAEFADAVGRLVPDLARTVVSPITEFSQPAHPPTVPSQKAAGTHLHEQEQGLLARLTRSLMAGGLGLKVGAGFAVLVLAAVLIVGLGGGDTLSRLFKSGGGDGGGTGEQIVGGGGTSLTGNEDSLPGPDLMRAARIDLNTSELSLTPGDSAQLEAEVFDVGENRLVDQEIHWRSDRPEVAEVDPRGWVTGGDPGNTTITASVGTVTESATVTVRRPTTSPPDSSTRPPADEECADPRAVLRQATQGLDSIDRETLQERLETARGCWRARDRLTDEETGFAAFSIGTIYFHIEGCSPNALEWFGTAVQHPSQNPVLTEQYHASWKACGGGTK